MTAKVAVLGCSGFIGGAVVQALEGRGAEVVGVTSPRLRTSARTPEGLRAELRRDDIATATAKLRDRMAGCAAVVNAAGMATAVSGLDSSLVGANGLLPAVVAAAAPEGSRFVHVSSAAVQGRRQMLDETPAVKPFSAYSRSKALGEQVVASALGVVVFRPTSVHGPGRPVTELLKRILASRAASVAGAGDRPTPQVLVGNVADAIAFLALSKELPPPIVLQPSEELTTGELVRVVGGREPLHVPLPVARLLVVAGSISGRSSGRIAGLTRRMEMAWFGQDQAPGWLSTRWRAPIGRHGWEDLVR